MSQIRKLLNERAKREGHWSYSVYMEVSRASRRWGLTPSKFCQLSDEDRAECIALERVEATMQAWESYQLEREIERRRQEIR